MSGGDGAWEHWAWATGLASIALLPAWDAIGSLPPHARSVAAAAWVLGGVAVLAVLVVASRTRRLPRALRWTAALVALPLLAWLLVDAAFYTVDILRTWVSTLAGPNYALVRNALAGGLVLLVVLGVLAASRQGLVATAIAARRATALASPMPLVVLVAWIWNPGTDLPAGAEDPAKSVTLVVVFDELDLEMIAQGGTTLPNLRALQSVALSATGMYPPANYTSESLPEMLSGVDYDEAFFTRREGYVRPPGGRTWLRLGKQPTLLAADAPGRRKSVIGWHLPYCTIFPALQDCWDDSAFRAPGSAVPLGTFLLGSSTLVKRMSDWRLDHLNMGVREFSKAFFSAPDKFRLQRIGEIFAEQRLHLLDVLVKGRSELVFAHLACPHPPAQSGDATLDIVASYQSNLMRCDALLGEIVAELRRADRPWQLVMASDHWFRGLDWLDSGKPRSMPQRRRSIPFFVWLDGADGRAWSTPALSSSRVLPQLVNSALLGRLNYSVARELIDATGDQPTELRLF